MDKMEDLPPQRRAEILAARLERSQRALSDAENALESRMKQLFRANQDLSLRESELARKLEIESTLLLGALSTIGMATVYGERERGFTLSEGANAILGLPDGEAATVERLVAALHPLDRDRIVREGRRFFSEKAAGVPHVYEHRIIRYGDGETRWLSWSITREESREGRPAYLLATVRDITEERQNKRQVRALQLRAERRVAELASLQSELAAAKERVEDTLTAVFTGSHGWFWRNRTGAPVTITLITDGAYSEVKRVV